MSRILPLLLSILPLLIWNKLRTLLQPDGMEAALHGGSNLNDIVLRFLAIRLAATGMTENDFLLMSLIVSLFFVAAGYFCDVLLAERGFGARGNSAVLFMGSSCAAAAWLLLAPKAYVGSLSLFVMACAIVAAIALVAGALIKAHLLMAFEDFSSGAKTKKPGPRGRKPRSAAAAIRRRATFGD